MQQQDIGQAVDEPAGHGVAAPDGYGGAPRGIAAWNVRNTVAVGTPKPSISTPTRSDCPSAWSAPSETRGVDDARSHAVAPTRQPLTCVSARSVAACRFGRYWFEPDLFRVNDNNIVCEHPPEHDPLPDRAPMSPTSVPVVTHLVTQPPAPTAGCSAHGSAADRESALDTSTGAGQPDAGPA